MRTHLFFVAVALAASTVAAAPRHWLWERGLPQGNNLTAVAATSATSALAVGDFGSIVQYTATGWTTRDSGTLNNLTGVAVSGTTAWAVGATATLVKSTDSGSTWAALSCTACGNLTAATFRSAAVGVIAGTGGIRYTTDGGATFTLATGSVTTIIKLAWSPSPSSTVVYGMTVGGQVYKSLNDGVTWVAGTSPMASGTSYGLTALSDTEVWVAAKAFGVFRNTASGTGVWAGSLLTAGAINYEMVGIAMSTATSVYVIGAPLGSSTPDLQFKLFSCTSAGCTEVALGTQKTDVWPQAIWASGTNLFIVGQGGMIFRSTNGTTFSNDGNATGQRYFDVASVDADHQVAAGAEGAISVGNFQIWSEFRCGTGDFQAVAVGTSTTVLVSNSGAVCFSANTNLATWSLGVSPAGNNARRTVAWVTGNTFVAGGDDGLVWYSTTGGTSWTVIDPDSTLINGLITLATRPSATPEVWAATGGLKLYKSSTPGAANYTDATAALSPSPTTFTPPGANVRDISWVDATTGFLVVTAAPGCNATPYEGYVYRTVNGGGSWQYIASLPQCSSCFAWDDLHAGNANNVWVQGEKCFAQVRLSGGTWTVTPQQVPTPLSLLGLGGTGAGELWMVGNYGAVLHSHCGGTDTATCTPDSNSCTDDACRPADGVCLATVNLANACTDGNACTAPDQCLADGGCSGALKSCDDSNGCTSDTCNPADAGCANVAAIGASCNDGLNCTTLDACLADATCRGTPIACQAGTVCTTIACAEATGTCVTTNLGSTVMCNDGLTCTDNDTCNGQGACAGASGCVSPSVCLVASCQADGGCGFTPVAGVIPCDDNNPCTTNDLCNAGTCAGSGTCAVDGGGGPTGGGGGTTGGGAGSMGGGSGSTGGGSGGAAGGGAGSTDGGDVVDAGTGPQPVFQPGCGCGSGGEPVVALMTLLGLIRRGRRPARA